eukprot:3443183-Amphidinium_carterae.1
MPPDVLQGKGHISATQSQVLKFEGQESEEWVQSASKEFSSLTCKALAPVTDEEWEVLPKIIAEQAVEVVESMFAWTVKAPKGKKKASIVLLGHLVNQYSAVSVSDLDTHLLSLLLAWTVSRSSGLVYFRHSNSVLKCTASSCQKDFGEVTY